VILSLEAPNTLGKVFQNLEKRIQVCLDVKRPVSASIMSRSCFPSFPVCVYKFSSHYLDNIIFIDNSLGTVATESPVSAPVPAYCRGVYILSFQFIYLWFVCINIGFSGKNCRN
jgi:hypothetical protein